MYLKKLPLIAFLTIGLSGFTQSLGILEQNNANATFKNNGIFFNDAAGPGYEIPKNSYIHSIYASAFWFGGLDFNGTLHLCAQKYGTNGQDMYFGPVANDYSLPAFQLYDRTWKVSKTEILNHQQNFNSAGYVVPSNIADWPGNGNTANGEAQHLAPYIDVNGNNIYDPENGDYPNIRGDEALYVICNDAGLHLASGGSPLGMEFHFMLYQFTSSDFIDNTTFVNIKIYNRSTTTYQKFKVGYFMDSDLGFPLDDFYGCAPEKNMIYTYNGNNTDPSTALYNGYGLNPPALGVKMLNHSMDVAGYFNNTPGPQGDPGFASEYWGYMNGYWGNSPDHFTEGGTGYGGTVNTNYLMPDNPNDTSGWSEVTEQNVPDDRRMFMTSDDFGTFAPGDKACYDFAILYSRTGDHLQNVDGLYGLADSVQTFFDNQTEFSCEEVLLSQQQQITPQAISVYPVPTENQITVGIDGQFDLEVYSLSGQLIMNRPNQTGNQPINLELPKGIYMVKVTQNQIEFFEKIIIE